MHQLVLHTKKITDNFIRHSLFFFVQQVDTTVLGLPQDEAKEKPYIASMGVYIFKKEILLNLLRYANSTQWSSHKNSVKCSI